LMLRYRLCAALLLAPVVAFLGVGCGGDKSKEQPQPITKTGEGGAKSGEGGAKAGDRTPLEVKATASLKGRVTFDGDPPPRPEIKIPDDNKDKDYCHKDTDLK